MDRLLKDHRIYAFGEFTLDPVAKVLFRNGQPVHLTRKAAETLLVLVQNSGTVLTKDEIMAAVWHDRVVDEANLTQNIAVIRKALAASRGTPAHIETFPARGYRLEGPVTASHETPAPASPVHSASPPVTEVAATVKSLSWRWPPLLATGFMIAIGAGVWSVSKTAAVAPVTETPLRVSPATRMPGKEFQPAISADGSRLAFLWSQDGAPPGVWLKNLAGDSPRKFSSKPGHYSSPAWSADGLQLAYLRIGSDSTEVIIAPVNGGPERVVTSLTPPNYGYESRLMDWSPDGAWLAVAHSGAPGRPLRLLLISARTGERRALEEPAADYSYTLDPRFSPSGDTITFLRVMHRSNQELYSLTIPTGEAKQLTSFGRRISSHDWTPDGRAIVFASDRTGEFRLWRMRLSEPAKLVPLSVYGEFPVHLAAARKSERLVYSQLQQDRNIWRLSFANKSWTRIIASTAQDASPQYSNDGSMICFRSDRSGEEQLWVSKSDGSDPVQVTRAKARPSVGRWSGDGASIVFNDPRTKEIFIARRNASGSWDVSNTGGLGVHPVFSPDGRWIYAGGLDGIVRIASSSGPAATVVRTPAESLSISPDGKYVYFVREADATSLWRANVDSGEIVQVLDGLVPACTSCWALAPRGIYYLGTDRRSFDAQVLYFHDFRTAEAQPVIHYPEPLWPRGSGPFSLSPAGGDLLTVRVDPSNSDVMLVSPQ